MLVVDSQAMIGLLRHPLRREILKYLIEKDEPLSPDQVSRNLGERLNSVSYHVRVLRGAGALILFDEHPVRGSMQHFYVHDEAVTGVPWVREALGLPELPESGGEA